MVKTLLILVSLGLVSLLLIACSASHQPEIGSPGRVSLIFFYTEA